MKSSRLLVNRGGAARQDWDLLLVQVGSEDRSLHVARRYSYGTRRQIAFFDDRENTLAVVRNVTELEDLGFDVMPATGSLRQSLVDVVDSLPDSAGSIALDISLFSVSQLAQVLDVLLLQPRALSVDFLYAPVEGAGWHSLPGPIGDARPVHPRFTAWADDPAQPLDAIIGVGAEDNLALGVAEYLDVSSIHAFVPVGGASEFDALNAHVNREFFLLSGVARRMQYDISEPFELFQRLESLIFALRSSHRVALVPLGPKVFGLCSLLAAAISPVRTTVWQFSVSESSELMARKAAGPIVSLNVTVRADGR